MSYWLVKSEPFKYSWDQFVADKQTFWDGVRNYGARNNLKGMKKGGMSRSAKDVAKDQQSMSNMATYARGGGIESRGKTKGTMVKMAEGGVVKFARGGGIESRGKTKGKMIKMKSGGYC
jgi:hypothetical protein